jgi:DNA-binding transcriptional MerR regulator
MTVTTAAPLLSIAEVAERAGVTGPTLRYYERVGLLSVGRDASGYRAYTEQDYARVVFLTRMRTTGMPIRDLQRYVALVAAGQSTVAQRLALMQAHRERVRARLDGLAWRWTSATRRSRRTAGAATRSPEPPSGHEDGPQHVPGGAHGAHGAAGVRPGRDR